MRTLAALALALTFGAGVAEAFHIPEATSGGIDYEARVAALLSYRDFDPIVDLRARIEDTDHELRYRALMLGSYYRVHPNVKVGAFVRVQQGVRHDDDWIFAGVWTNPWFWDDTRDRTEVVAIADVTPRVQLGFLPGENWVFALKGRYELNTWNSQQTIIARPTLTYFWIVDRLPVLNVSLAWEGWFPLNFSTVPIYEEWVYLDTIYHLTPTVKLEGSLAHKRVTWTDSSKFDREFPGQSYEKDAKSWQIGLGVLYVLPL